MLTKTVGRRALTATMMVLIALAIGSANGYGIATPVNLGTAGNYVILAQTGVSTTTGSAVVGNIGLSPAAATYITGFGALPLEPGGTYSTSPVVTGYIYAADYAPPTPSNLTTAVGDMQTAYTDAAGRAPDSTELHAGDLSGQTMYPGVYGWSTGVLINSSLALSGGPTAVWIFQIAGTLTVGNGAIVTLSGGARPQNIFWQVAGQATLGSTSQFKGTILGQTAIVLQTGATLGGKALAQTAVTLDASVIPAGVEFERSTGPAYGKLQLMPCSPNPASGAVNIRYALPRPGTVSLSIYDICGRCVNTLVQGQKQAGANTVTWRGDDSRGRMLPASVYFYRLNFEGSSLTRRLVLVR